MPTPPAPWPSTIPTPTRRASASSTIPPTITSYLGTTVPGDGTHVRVFDWDLGTTEPGSSGSPLFDQNHHVIGQLHGGYAACGNDLSDYYGRFFLSYPSVSQYLDPLGTGAVSLDTYAPWATGLLVKGGAYTTQGDAGGPFAPATRLLAADQPGGLPHRLPGHRRRELGGHHRGRRRHPGRRGDHHRARVAVNAAANALPNGGYQGTLSFVNLTDGDGDTGRGLSLVVGVPVGAADLHPGQPTRAGPPRATGPSACPWAAAASHGNADPTTGFTGDNVYGYNLAGDYPNNLAEQYLTSARHRLLAAGRRDREVPALAQRGAAVLRPRLLRGQHRRRELHHRLDQRQRDRRRGLDPGQLRHRRHRRRPGHRVPALDHGHHRRQLDLLGLELRRRGDLGRGQLPLRGGRHARGAPAPWATSPTRSTR